MYHWHIHCSRVSVNHMPQELIELPSGVDSATPGIVVAVVHDGEISDLRVGGRASLEFDVPVDRDTVFAIASVSKQFTAATVASLHLEGVLDLDADLRDLLPLR